MPVEICVYPTDLFYTFNDEFRLTHARFVSGIRWEDKDIPLDVTKYNLKGYHGFNCHPLRVPAARTRSEIPRALAIYIMNSLGYLVREMPEPKVEVVRLFQVTWASKEWGQGKMTVDAKSHTEAMDKVKNLVPLQEPNPDSLITGSFIRVDEIKPSLTRTTP